MKDRTQKLARKACAWLALLVTGILLGGCALLDLVPPLPPDQAPTRVTASPGEFRDRIHITWAAVERATFYEVFRAESAAGPFQPVGDSAAPAFDDLDVVEGQLYWYRVRACNATGCGPESTVVSGYAGRPPAPANVRASENLPAKITITWDPVPGATHYQVFRDLHREGTFGSFVGMVETPVIEDTTAAVGLRYWYRVRAFNDHGGSALSQPDSGCRDPCPAPRGLLDAEG